MKRIICILLTTIVISFTFNANATNIYRKYSNNKDVQAVKVGKFMLKLARTFADSDDYAEKEALDIAIEYIDDMRVLIFEDSRYSTRENLLNDIDNLSSEGYELLIDVTDDDDRVRIYTLEKRDVIRELIIFVSDGEDDMVFMDIKGRIPIDKVGELVALSNID